MEYAEELAKAEREINLIHLRLWRSPFKHFWRLRYGWGLIDTFKHYPVYKRPENLDLEKNHE